LALWSTPVPPRRSPAFFLAAAASVSIDYPWSSVYSSNWLYLNDPRVSLKLVRRLAADVHRRSIAVDGDFSAAVSGSRRTPPFRPSPSSTSSSTEPL
jgi:hypothetical protein